MNNPKSILRAFWRATENYDGDIVCRQTETGSGYSVFIVETDGNTFDAVMYDDDPMIVFYRTSGAVNEWRCTDLVPCVEMDGLPRISPAADLLPPNAIPSFIAREANVSVENVFDYAARLHRLPTASEMRNAATTDIEHLMSVSGKSRATIYYYARKLGRMPTADELTAEHKKTGRPRKKWR